MTSIAVKCRPLPGRTQDSAVHLLQTALRGLKDVTLHGVDILFPAHKEDTLRLLFVVKVEGDTLQALARLQGTVGVEYAHEARTRRV